METTTDTVAPRSSGAMSRFLRALAIVAAGIIAAIPLSELRKIDAPGAPVALVYAAIAVAVITFLLQLPVVFYRLSQWGRLAATLMMVITVALTGVESGQMTPAWEATAQGKREAADSAERHKELQAADVEEARRAAESEKVEKEAGDQVAAAQAVVDARKNVEACFSTFGHHLSSFEDQVRESLENPKSFEHVKTIAVDPDLYGRNVEMTLRAENAMGAIRTAKVRAKVNPEDCAVADIGNIED